MSNHLSHSSESNDEKLDDELRDNCKPFVIETVNLNQLWDILWSERIKIIVMTLLFASISVFVALLIPNRYQSHTVLVSTQANSGGGLAGISSSFGGLAALAGVNVNQESSRMEQAILLGRSWPFIETFVNKHELKAKIMATEGFDQVNNELIYDLDKYNPINGEWMIKDGESSEPTSFETYQVFRDMLSIELDSKSGLVTIALEFYSPDLAYEWVVLLKKELNLYFQRLDTLEAKQNVEYLQRKIAETNLTEMHSVFYKMIESQTQTLMLAESSSEYVLKTLVPAKVAEEKSFPNRAIICIVITFLGGVFALVVVLMLHHFKGSFNNNTKCH
ncbi:Wzz/FepE/Etk N-terminal domain-containing protein [Catenovulum sp. SX2]|uniref:Wzz/FepE/Etk N-terminal domain-containing protein n=1 Tax=Catenovulum sp. SX2 TaxID=3398614 RepID=UPI003F8542E0